MKMCSKKSRFIKEQEVTRIISSKEKSLSKIPLVDPILFRRYEMSEIVNNFLLAGDEKFMFETHLRQPEFTYSAWRSFNKNK